MRYTNPRLRLLTVEFILLLVSVGTVLLINGSDTVIQVLMLTLQNDPPTIDTNADSLEQYKNYGKTFRKIISDCLKKEPEQRPTAKQLLKHELFKKAKVSYLLVSLLYSFICVSEVYHDML